MRGERWDVRECVLQFEYGVPPENSDGHNEASAKGSATRITFSFTEYLAFFSQHILMEKADVVGPKPTTYKSLHE